MLNHKRIGPHKMFAKTCAKETGELQYLKQKVIFLELFGFVENTNTG
jgi:hypothetical protein